MKSVSVITSSVTLVLALALNGCGGGSSASTDGIDLAGKAIDPYLSGSKVCLDINDNGTCEVNEPVSYTGTDGNYTLHIAQEYHQAHHALIVSGGKDIGTNTIFAGTLTAVKEASQTRQNITPLTTLVEARYRYCQATPSNTCHTATVDQITTELSDYLDVPKEQINADIVELANNGNDTPLKTALALETSAESHYAAHPHQFYEEMGVEGFPIGHDWREDIKTFLTPKESSIVTKVMNIDDDILENAGFIVEVEARKSASGTEVEVGTENLDVERENSSLTRAHIIAQYVHGLLQQEQ